MSPGAAHSNRMFMHRAARYVADRGVTQFLDIGTGIPTSPNLHEVVQAVVPEARIVYVDNDPIVLAHSRALLTSLQGGKTSYLEADVDDPQAILGSEEVKETLDLSKPVALSLVGLFHYLPDYRKPYDLVKALLEPLVPGSYLIFSHCTPDWSSRASRCRTAGTRTTRSSAWSTAVSSPTPVAACGPASRSSRRSSQEAQPRPLEPHQARLPFWPAGEPLTLLRRRTSW